MESVTIANLIVSSAPALAATIFGLILTARHQNGKIEEQKQQLATQDKEIEELKKNIAQQREQDHNRLEDFKKEMRTQYTEIQKSLAVLQDRSAREAK